jgi:hypothetical protein
MKTLPETLLISLLFASSVAAHSPVLDMSPKTAEAPFVIEEPEHSKAIFAELTGAPQFYQITSAESFDFYVGITAPKLENCDLIQTFSFEVLDARMQQIDIRDGSAAPWKPWYEEFGKKWYWAGPEIGSAFAHDRRYAAGTYFIRVFNAQNTGQYVLAVGDQEEFGILDVFTLPGKVQEINKLFWDETTCR